MNQKYDAIVIGAGIIGTAVGCELARKGYRTLNIDKLPAAGYGPTGASCAIIRTHYSTFDGAAIAYEGYFYWEHWPEYIGVDDERGLAKFYDCGCMVIRTELNGYLDKVIANMDALSIPYELWDPAQIKKRFPIYDLHQFGPVRRPDDADFGTPGAEEVKGAVFFPTAGYISDPQLSTHNIQRAAEAAGGEFLFNAKVTEIVITDDRVAGVVLDNGERIASPVVVNVAGPYSQQVNEMAGVTGDMNIATKALKQEVVHIPSPDGFDYQRQGMVTSDSDIGCYTRPEQGNYILIGSEDPACDEREWVDADTYDDNFSEQWRVQALRMAQRISGLRIPSDMRGVVSLYDVSDDWIPIYDKSSLPGFYLAIGTSGNQFKNAPVVGVMMAALIDQCEQGHDHDADPVQFTMRYTNRTIDVGFYSRRRDINPESSFSVLG
ncbi:MAG: FAD-binding oxidoreductase [Gammaproteobacteria bacterium]|nr:FAD-binding oxidoreductase [Gammaproteobacteria bacterium]